MTCMTLQAEDINLGMKCVVFWGGHVCMGGVCVLWVICAETVTNTNEARHWVWDEPDSPLTPGTKAKKEKLRKWYLNSNEMRKNLEGPYYIKYRNWVRCATHPNYERWLHGSPDEKGNKIVPPEDIDDWIYNSPRRYLESDLGGPPVKRKIG